MEFKKIIENIQNITQNKDYYPTYENTADNEHEGHPSAQEALDPRTASMHELLMLAAERNLIIEAGKTFPVNIRDDLKATPEEIKAESAMLHHPNRPVPLDTDGENMFFLATATKALVPYREITFPPLHDTEAGRIAAD